MTDDGANTRRRFLKGATLGLGGAMTIVVAAPVLRTLGHPIGQAVVSTGEEPVDVMAVSDLVAGGPPVRVELVAKAARDGWAVSSGVPLGAAYVQKLANGEVVALSSVCPHLGCSIAHAAAERKFRCPCHRSAFAESGERLEGPVKRGLDPLPVAVENGRVMVTFVRYRPDIAERVKA